MQSFRLGSILGFEIRIDLSWFIIFFLILWSLSAGVFPQQFPQLSTGTHVAMGVVGILLFFASLLAHELSHSVVAKAKGIPVEGITLFIFGGMSRTRMEAESPGDEFQIAGIGPLVSLILAALFGLVWLGGNTAGWSEAVTGVVAYLASINLLLAIFNLLPGFPLDGGRLFRSIIWKITGDLQKATRIASWGGRFLGYLLIGFGIFRLLSANILGGFWLILIGWFLNSAAEASYQEQFLGMGLEGVRAREAMTHHPETVPPDLTLQELVDDYFLHRRFQAFPVTRNDSPVGIITLNQVKQVPRDQWSQVTVQDAMTPLEESTTVSPEEKMSDVVKKMQDSGARRVLVLRNQKLEGIITASDITGWLRRVRDLGRQ
jgi:Zn-dependent protease